MNKKTFNVNEMTFFQKVNKDLLSVIFALIIIGLINLFSATHSANLNINARLFYQQLVWLTFGIIIFFFVTKINYDFWRRISWPFYLLNLFALIIVMFIGRTFYGAQRWLDLGFFRFQPSETMKIAIVFVLARYLSKKKIKQGLDLKDLIFPAVITGVPFILTVKQPDLGTALLIAAVSLSLIIFVKVKNYILIAASIITIVAAPIAWNFGLKPYQKNRVLTFLSPGRDPRGSGYNSIQSKIAVGSGEILGKGFRKGTQSQLEFIPERHSDFIYCVLSEEHGFIGSLFTLLLFVYLFHINFQIAMNAKDKFGALVAVGLTSIVFWHVFINISMVIGILPIVGVPLPLLSYGGSSLLATLFSLGVISSISYRKNMF